MFGNYASGLLFVDSCQAGEMVSLISFQEGVALLNGASLRVLEDVCCLWCAFDAVELSGPRGR